ncbi:death domain-associated protein 6-like [Schistocerca nitens]|uniref:death domain-associated protein 6-like n=1 Tax=Schistocerca nitens TaxID=7011 RepID=UPI002117A2BF|nr:death domain-associated protein 6-like [Schistocerca nitens]
MSLEMFIMKCLKYDKSADMCKIIDAKVKKYYHACNAAYTSSETFKKLLQTRMELIDKDPKNLYVYIKEVVDELKLRGKKDPPRKKIKLETDSPESSNLEKPTEEVKAVKEEPHFQERAAKKLSKMLHCLQRRITKLEQKEVDWDEENDSTYIQLQRYKERAVAVYKKLQQYECGAIPKLQERRAVTYSGTAFPSVNRAIEKYVNKTGQFPDYQDVLKLLKSAYEEEKMNISPERLRNQAKAAFQTIGEQLQRQRQFSTWNAHSHYLGDNRDPAEDDQELDEKLRENKKDFGSRINEVINKFADQTKDMIPEEVADDEIASKSEDEEEDGSEKETVDGSETEDDFVDKILADIDNNDNDTSENEEESNEESDGKVDGEDLQTEEAVCEDNNSKQTENEEEIVVIHEQKSEHNNDNKAKLLREAERSKKNEKCNLLQESPRRELKERVVIATASIKVEAHGMPHKIDVRVSNFSSEMRPSKLQDRHNGMLQKCEQSKNNTSEFHSHESKQVERHLTTHPEIDNDSDNDVIILE